MIYLLNQVFVSYVQQEWYTVLCGGPDLWETHFSTVLCLSGKVENITHQHKNPKKPHAKTLKSSCFQ